MRLRLCLTVAVLCLAAGCVVSPVTGRGEFSLLSEREELALGDASHPDVVFMYDGEYLDPDLKRYLGTIVLRLSACTHRPRMRTDFTLLNSSVVNAFAIPGHVYATRGFVAKIVNEAQFAAVMGHELGHVAAGHSGKRMSRQQVMLLGLGLTGAVLGDGAGSQAALAVGQAGAAVFGLSYSRDMERQADRLGAYYMALAGWDPREALTMQRLLHGIETRKEGKLDKYLTTHPPMAERLVEIDTLMREKALLARGWVQGDGVFAQRWARLTAELRRRHAAFAPYDRGVKELAANRREAALASAREALSLRTDQAPFHRLEGDALLALGRADEALASYQRALAVDARYVPARLGIGKVDLTRQSYAEAEAEFAGVVRSFPGSPAGHYGLGFARFRQGRYQAAIAPLERVVRTLPAGALPIYVLAQCYDQTGRTADARSAYRAALRSGLTGPERTQALRRTRQLGGNP